MFYYISFIAWLLIGLGILALLTNLGFVSSSIWIWWPVLLVAIGIFVLVVKKKRKKIVLHGILQRLATDDRVQNKLKKIVEKVD
jgi:heme exporter protein D